jgi:hypothetical protein
MDESWSALVEDVAEAFRRLPWFQSYTSGADRTMGQMVAVQGDAPEYFEVTSIS